MTNNVLGVDNSINTNAYNRATSTSSAGQLFSSIFQAKMNTATMSIGDFDSISTEDNSDIFGSNSLYGTNSNSSLYGTGSNSLFGTSSLYGTNNLYGTSNGLGTGSSSLNTDTILVFILAAMMLGGDSDGSQMMLTSLSQALTGGNNYRTYAQSNNTFNGLSLTGSAAKSTYVTPGTGSYPSSMGKACSPSVVNNVGNRSAAAYKSVIEQFNVETNSRYTPYKNGSTYCNIYVWDVTTAMGAQIPHRVDSQGNIATSSTSNVKYMTANRMYDWLGGEKGKEYGWKEVTAEEAQKYANMGCPAVAAWKNPKGHGHIQMVVPSKDGQYNSSKGVAISQAGSKVIEYGYISDVYKSSRLKDIKYFVHA